MNGLAPSYFKGSISGSICIDDIDITGMTAWEIGTIVGSVFQNPKSQFFSSELVGEVAFGCENHGFSREAIQERTDKSIETFSLSLIRKRPLDVLSSGEKQRVAIASVYAMRPKVFVCDEPTANLDLGGIEQLLGTLFKLKAQGYTLVIAEHRLSWLSELADRIIIYGKREDCTRIHSQGVHSYAGNGTAQQGASDDAPCTNTRTATTSETFRAWVADYARPV